MIGIEIYLQSVLRYNHFYLLPLLLIWPKPLSCLTWLMVVGYQKAMETPKAEHACWNKGQSRLLLCSESSSGSQAFMSHSPLLPLQASLMFLEYNSSSLPVNLNTLPHMSSWLAASPSTSLSSAVPLTPRSSPYIIQNRTPPNIPYPLSDFVFVNLINRLYVQSSFRFKLSRLGSHIPLPLHMQSLPHRQHPSPEQDTYYNRWTYTDTSLSPIVHSLHQGALLVLDILWVWTNV